MASTGLQGEPDLSYRPGSHVDDVEKSSTVLKGDDSVKVVRADFSYQDTRKILRKVYASCFLTLASHVDCAYIIGICTLFHS